MNSVTHDHPGPDTVLLWAGHSAIYEGLVQAMRAHLPNYRVLLAEHLTDATAIAPSVRLVLLDVEPRGIDTARVQSCQQNFPHAPIGLVMRTTEQGLAQGGALLDRGDILGLLPLELKLEIWLAALTLMLQGGEYCPPEWSRRRRRAAPLASARSVGGIDQLAAFQIAAKPAVHLTRRERQVLELLSEGYQNKLIADRMALSEHTVKVHVHNLITKMRVSNRTQAAAAYRSGRFDAPSLGRSQLPLAAYEYPGRH